MQNNKISWALSVPLAKLKKSCVRVSSVSSRIASVGAPLSDDERERKRAKKDSMLLSLALSTALVLPSRHAPVLMQQQGQYVVEPPPPKGFVWSTFGDMTGSVTPTSFVAATPSAKTPAKAPFSQLYSTITAVPASLKQPAIIPAETSISESVDQLGSMAVEEEKTRIVAPDRKSVV